MAWLSTLGELLGGIALGLLIGSSSLQKQQGGETTACGWVCFSAGAVCWWLPLSSYPHFLASEYSEWTEFIGSTPRTRYRPDDTPSEGNWGDRLLSCTFQGRVHKCFYVCQRLISGCHTSFVLMYNIIWKVLCGLSVCFRHPLMEEYADWASPQ